MTDPRLDEIRYFVRRLDAARFANPTLLTEWEIIDGLPADAPQPDHNDPRWTTIRHHDAWGRSGGYAWFRVKLPINIEQFDTLRLQLFDYSTPPADALGLNELMRSAGAVYGEGLHPQAINRGHNRIDLSGLQGDWLYVYAAGGYSPERRTLHQSILSRIHGPADALFYDIDTLHRLIAGGAKLPDKEFLIAEMLRAIYLIDWRRELPDSEGMEAAHEYLWQHVFGHASANRPLIHAVGHAHIDLGWLWPLSYAPGKGYRNAITQLHLMEKYPFYTFLQTQPQLYQSIQKLSSETFDKIRAKISDGRWNATGATWVEMDCNLPSGESLVRQFLHGIRYFEHELGVRPRVLWLPDTFGFTGALPQIMQQCGVPYFFTSKMSWNDTNRLPYDTFMWRGIDGTSVLAHMATTRRRPETTVTVYDGEFTPYEAASTWETYRQQTINRHTLIAYGYGDGGGGATRAMCERLIRYKAGIPGMADVQPSTAEVFFEALERDLRGRLPTWQGELYFEMHRGVYTSQARTKRYNRKLEQALHDAEFLRAWAFFEAKLLYPRAELRAAWDILLTNQFHDILPGSSIRETYIQAEGEYYWALNQVEALIQEGMAALAALADSDAEWMIFNTTGQYRSAEVIQLPKSVSIPDDEKHFLCDEFGNQQVSDLSPNSEILVRISSIGSYAQDGLRRVSHIAETRSDKPASVSVATNHLSNVHWNIHFDERGRITSLWDKHSNRELILPGRYANLFEAFQDVPHQWDAWEIAADFDEHRLPEVIPAGIEVVESGTLRAAVKVTYQFGSSRLEQVISLTDLSPIIRFDTRVEWYERHTLLKVAFPINFPTPRALFETAFGFVERSAYRNTKWDQARFEVPMQRWAALQQGEHELVGLLNDSKYGCDVNGSTLRLTLLRAPTAPDGEADQGLHEFSYALVRADSLSTICREAVTFNAPLRAIAVTPRAKGTPKRRHFAGFSGPSEVILDTVKLAEDSTTLIVRAYEPIGNSRKETFQFSRHIQLVEPVNLLEESIGEPLPLLENKRAFSVAFKPFEIRSFRITFAD